MFDETPAYNGVVHIFNLHIAKVQFHFQAETRVNLPSFKESASRGGLGQVMKKMICIYSIDKPCYECELTRACAFSVVFAPSNPEGGFLKNHKGIPRPYSLYIPDERNAFLPGEEFTVEMTLVGKAIEYFPYIFLAFKELGKSGMGKKTEEGKRGKFVLKRIEEIMKDGSCELIYHSDELANGKKIKGFYLYEFFAQDRISSDTDTFKLVFETPVRLKKDRHITDVPEFYPIMRSIIHKLNAYSYFYGNGEIKKDVASLLEEAKNVKLISANTAFKQYVYYSRRQQNKLYMGGIVGEAVYRGNLNLFYPYLKIAEVIGVGKNNAFGFGRVKLQALQGEVSES